MGDGAQPDALPYNDALPWYVPASDPVACPRSWLWHIDTDSIYSGIEMLNTPWSDGVPGVTQREIPPGGSFLYKWKATQYGAYWYHAHRHGQLDDGQYGPLTIHPKENTPTPFSLISQDRNTITAIENAVANAKPIQLTEWRHLPSDDIRKIEIAANMEVPCYDSLLINGKGKVDCWSANKTASLLSPEQKQLLAIIPGINSMTAKSYVISFPIPSGFGLIWSIVVFPQ